MAFESWRSAGSTEMRETGGQARTTAWSTAMKRCGVVTSGLGLSVGTNRRRRATGSRRMLGEVEAHVGGTAVTMEVAMEMAIETSTTEIEAMVEAGHGTDKIETEGVNGMTGGVIETGTASDPEMINATGGETNDNIATTN